MTSKTPAPAAEEAAIPAIRTLSRSDILDCDDLATERVAVPEWGGEVVVRALTGVERDAYETEIFLSNGRGRVDQSDYNLQNIRAKLGSRTMVDEEGSRLFSDADVAVLGLKSAAALDRVFSVAQRLSRLTAADVKELTEQMGKSLSAASGSG